MDERIRSIQGLLKEEYLTQFNYNKGSKGRCVDYFIEQIDADSQRKEVSQGRHNYANALIPISDILSGACSLNFFDLPKNLLYMLYKTDFDCSGEDLKYPFSTFFLLFPQIVDSPRYMYSVCAVSEAIASDPNEELMCSLTFYNTHRSISLVSIPFFPDRGKNVIQLLDNLVVENDDRRFGGTFFEDRCPDILVEYQKLVVKFLIYLSMKNNPAPYLRKTKKRKRSKGFSVPVPPQNYNVWDIGTTIQLAHKEGSPGELPGSGKTWTLRNRSITRGHMKWQWSGPKDNRTRSLIWIRPYIRGAHLPPPAVGHIYKI